MAIADLKIIAKFSLMSSPKDPVAFLLNILNITNRINDHKWEKLMFQLSKGTGTESHHQVSCSVQLLFNLAVQSVVLAANLRIQSHP